MAHLDIATRRIASGDLSSPVALPTGDSLAALADGLVDTSERQIQFPRAMQDKAGLLGHRIAHLVELARLTTMEWRQTMVPTDLAGFLAETMARLADEASAAGGDLDLDLAWPAGLIMPLNRDMVRRVLENLVDNARNYAPTGAALRASAWVPDGAACLAIANPEPGIPAEQRAMVFDRWPPAPMRRKPQFIFWLINWLSIAIASLVATILSTMLTMKASR